MKILLFRLKGFIAEENRFGYRVWPEMPSALPLATHYLRRKGFEVKQRDHCNGRPLPLDGCDMVVAFAPICDGLPHALTYLREAKQQGCLTVLAAFDDWETMQRDIVRDFAFVDFAVRGLDREIALESLIRGLQNGGGLDEPMPGVVARINGQVIDGGLNNVHAAGLDHLDACTDELTELGPSHYQQFFIRAASGCPFGCTYCHIGRRPMRCRPAAAVAAEMALVPQGRQIRLGTTDMLLNRKWSRALLDRLEAANIRCRFDIDARADTVIKNKDLLPQLQRCGCSDLVMGGESFHPDILAATRKGVTFEQYMEAAELVRTAGMNPMFTMMIGHPLESHATLETTLRQLEALPLDIAINGFQYLRPLPGSQIEKECLQAGLITRTMTYTSTIYARNQPYMPTRFLSEAELVTWMARINRLLVQRHQQLLERRRPAAAVADKPGKAPAKSAPAPASPVIDTAAPDRICDLSPHNLRIYELLLAKWRQDATIHFDRPEEMFQPADEQRRSFFIRHDVDFEPDRVLRFTRIEARLNLRSTIYVIVDPKYYSLDAFQSQFRELHAQGFTIGLHSTAPAYDVALARFVWECERFAAVMGFRPRFFTLHGVCPHPPDWPERLLRFKNEVGEHLDRWQMFPTTQWCEDVHSVEDSGDGSGFSYLKEAFLCADRCRPGAKVELLTHAEHWTEHPVQWQLDGAQKMSWFDLLMSIRR